LGHDISFCREAQGGPPAAWQGPIKKIPRTKNHQIQCSGKLQKGCCTNDQAETSVLFELIAERYERKSLAITANAPFSAWDEVFPDKAMTVAAVDRLVHHSTILEMNVDSYRRRAALPARRQRSATLAQ
jgi:hypothetical protein